MKHHNGVWVLGDFSPTGNISGNCLDILHKGRQICETLSQPLTLICLGQGLDADDIAGSVADRVYLFDHPELENFHPERYLSALSALASEQEAPSLIMASHAPQWQDLLPRLAVRHNSRAVTDCISITPDPQNDAFTLTKPVFGGNIMAQFSCTTLPALITLRPGKTNTDTPAVAKPVEVCAFPWQPDLSKELISLEGRTRETLEGLRLEEAGTVIAGGKGMGGPDGFERLKEMADLMGAAIGSSRPPCDLGWISPATQVGITGKIVAPELYIAVGISGMMQHLTGMSSAGVVVAVNPDPQAPIYKYADLGVVGEHQDVLPAFIKTLKKLSPVRTS